MAFTQKTIDELGAIIKRPALTEKLLSKPPFRFIHDIVSAVVKATGFGEGLYEGDETDSKMKERERKVAFLTKILDCVGIALDTTVEMQPLKVLAGLEPETTNAFLVQLAAAAKAGPNPDAVQRVLAGEHQSLKKVAGSTIASADGAGGSSPARAKGKSKGKGKGKRRPKPSDPAADTPAPEPAAPEPEPEPEPQPEPAAEPAAEPEAEPEPEPARTRPSGKGRQPVVGTAKGKGKTTRTQYKPPEERGDAPARPMTARRGPPKQQSNVRTVETKEKAEPMATKPSAGLILDGENEDESEDEIIIEEEAEDGLGLGGDAGGDAGAPKDGEPHGQLVRQMMKAQEEDEKRAAKLKEPEQAKAGAKSGSGIKLERKSVKGTEPSKRVNIAGEVTKLRDDLQALTKSTNPVGKCMDYVHEDLETMARELEHWREQNKSQASSLEELSRNTAASLQPLRAQLADLDAEIKDQESKIKVVKATVMENDATIQNLLRMVVSSQ